MGSWEWVSVRAQPLYSAPKAELKTLGVCSFWLPPAQQHCGLYRQRESSEFTQKGRLGDASSDRCCVLGSMP